MPPFQKIGNVPFDGTMISTLFPKIKSVSEKARLLERSGKIIRLKRGLYVADPDESGKPLNKNLIANHIYGPSYISLNTALRHYGLIPEYVYLTQSLTTKHTRRFDTPIGSFEYENCSKEYFPIGVRLETDDGANYMIASPEKALCDLIGYSKAVNLRFLKDVEAYLEEDIRFDTDALASFDIKILESCSKFNRKTMSINTLIKYIKDGRHI